MHTYTSKRYGYMYTRVNRKESPRSSSPSEDFPLLRAFSLFFFVKRKKTKNLDLNETRLLYFDEATLTFQG